MHSDYCKALLQHTASTTQPESCRLKTGVVLFASLLFLFLSSRQAWKLHQTNKGSPALAVAVHTPVTTQTAHADVHFSVECWYSVDKGITTNRCSLIQRGCCKDLCSCLCKDTTDINKKIHVNWINLNMQRSTAYLSGSALHPCLLPLCWFFFFWVTRD